MSLHAMFVGAPTWETITYESFLMGLPSQNTGKASCSLKLPSSEIIVSPGWKANSPPQWGI
jgi:hypothetical protein